LPVGQSEKRGREGGACVEDEQLERVQSSSTTRFDYCERSNLRKSGRSNDCNYCTGCELPPSVSGQAEMPLALFTSPHLALLDSRKACISSL
jgi:hypothetical protein